jgi:hypothetical protein
MTFQVEQIKCKCGKTFPESELKESLQEFEDGRVHVRAECPYCNQYVKYQSYSKSKIVSKMIRFAYQESWKAVADSIVRYKDSNV